MFFYHSNFLYLIRTFSDWWATMKGPWQGKLFIHVHKLCMAVAGVVEQFMQT